MNLNNAGSLQTRSGIDLTTLIKNVSLLQLPSVLWKVNYDSNQTFLIFCTLNVNGNTKNSKSVVLTSPNKSYILANILLNSKPVNITTLKKTVSSLEDLSALLDKVDKLEICRNNLLNKDSCLLLCTERTDICTKCMELKEANTNSQGLISKPTLNTKAPIIHHEIAANLNFLDSLITNKNSNTHCKLCNERVEDSSEMLKHEYEHFPNNNENEFKCSICSEILDDTIVIIKHYYQYHNAVKFIKCLQCKRQFSNINSLKRHAREHESVCLKCKLKFKNQNLFEKHICNPSILNTKKKNYLCEICQVKYSTYYLFKQHQKEHEISKVYKCSACTMKYKNKKQLLTHKRYCNMKRLQFACVICSHRFSCTSQKEFHMNTKHPNVKVQEEKNSKNKRIRN